MSRVGRKSREDVMAELTQEWRDRMIGVDHSWSQIAEAAGVTTGTAIEIMKGMRPEHTHATYTALVGALDRLRGTCPHCGQKLPPKGVEDAAI